MITKTPDMCKGEKPESQIDTVGEQSKHTIALGERMGLNAEKNVSMTKYIQENAPAGVGDKRANHNAPSSIPSPCTI